MASVIVVAGLLAVWIFAAAAIGLLLGRVVRMRDLQRPGPARRPGADLAGTRRTVASLADPLGD